MQNADWNNDINTRLATAVQPMHGSDWGAADQEESYERPSKLKPKEAVNLMDAFDKLWEELSIDTSLHPVTYGNVKAAKVVNVTAQTVETFDSAVNNIIDDYRRSDICDEKVDSIIKAAIDSMLVSLKTTPGLRNCYERGLYTKNLLIMGESSSCESFMVPKTNGMVSYSLFQFMSNRYKEEKR